MLIDSHVHLDDRRYDNDREDVLQRAEDAGVEACVTIGCDVATSRAAVALAQARRNVFATIGVHPHETGHITGDWHETFRELARQPKVVAYGEIGLDYHYDHSPRDVQRRRFREQIQLARELRLPMVIHTREAPDDTVMILREENAQDVGGVFHCFSGDARLAGEALDMGFYLSFSGVLTFKNAAMLRETAGAVPLDRIMVETDCPYLAPVPHRGARNEPAYVRHVAHTLAEIHGKGRESFESIALATAQNTKRVFGIP